MASTEHDLIRRFHSAINRSMAEQRKKKALMRMLQTENLRLRQELATLKSQNISDNEAAVAIRPCAHALNR